MEHELKTDAPAFESLRNGDKSHELRKDDRHFQVGDTLRLRETRFTGAEMAAGAPLEYTGREEMRRVSHILRGYGLNDGWVVLSCHQPVVGMFAGIDDRPAKGLDNNEEKAPKPAMLNSSEFHALREALGVPEEEVAISHQALAEVMARHEICCHPIGYDSVADDEGRMIMSVVFLNCDASKLYAMNRELDALLAERLEPAHPWVYIAMFERCNSTG